MPRSHIPTFDATRTASTRTRTTKRPNGKEYDIKYYPIGERGNKSPIQKSKIKKRKGPIKKERSDTRYLQSEKKKKERIKYQVLEYLDVVARDAELVHHHNSPGSL